MNVLLFGATGMIGRGVLAECLRDAGVRRVVVVVRRSTGVTHAKLREIVQDDVRDLAAHADGLRDVDACFFCLGVSAAGMSEARYTELTHDLPLDVAQQLVALAPSSVFVYVSGLGTDAGERGRSMWARVKGRTENALRTLPFRATYMFRPGLVQPLEGLASRTFWYRVLYGALRPVFPLLRRAFPDAIVTTAELGRAMVRVARDGAPRPVLESRDISRLARAANS